MTRFIDVGDVQGVISNTCLERSPVFLKDVEHVTHMDMLVLSKWAEMKEGRDRGRELTRLITREVLRMSMLGVIPSCPASAFIPATRRLTIGEFRKILEKFDLVERQLIVFSLAVGASPTECSFLLHKEAKQKANINKWSHEVRRFIQAMPRHIRCDFVFWRYDASNRPIALVGFESKFRQVVKAQWRVFAELCKDLIPVDADADAKEFATMFLLESSQR